MLEGVFKELHSFSHQLSMFFFFIEFDEDLLALLQFLVSCLPFCFLKNVFYVQSSCCVFAVHGLTVTACLTKSQCIYVFIYTCVFQSQN